MPQQFVDVNTEEFTLNGIPFDKIFIAMPVGSDSIQVVGAYESRNVILPVTPVSDIEINGTTYLTQASLIQVLKGVVYNSLSNVVQYEESNFLGVFADPAALIAAHPTANAGEYAFTLENGVPEDGVFEYRWNPATEEWQIESTPTFIESKTLHIGEYPSPKILLWYWEGIIYDTDVPTTISTFYPAPLLRAGGWARRIIDTTGKTEFPSVNGSTELFGSHDFEADALFDLWVNYDGSRIEHFFTKR